MTDYLVKAVAGNGKIRAFITSTHTIVETARKIHQTSPVVTKALGRLLTAGALMGSMMKNADELLTLKIAGDGPMSGLLVTADALGTVKGYAYVPDLEDTVENPLLVSEAIGNGDLTILKDIGLKEPYSGYTPLVSGEIAEDITYYYAQSEQTPTSVSLGVLLNDDGSVKQAGGFMIQLLPDTDEETITTLEKNLSELASMTKLLDQGKTADTLLDMIFHPLECHITAQEIPKFFCNCSKDRVTKALLSIGEKDLREMISSDENLEINCDFCGEKYLFTKKNFTEFLEVIQKYAKEKEGKSV